MLDGLNDAGANRRQRRDCHMHVAGERGRHAIERLAQARPQEDGICVEIPRFVVRRQLERGLTGQPNVEAGRERLLDPPRAGVDLELGPLPRVEEAGGRGQERKLLERLVPLRITRS